MSSYRFFAKNLWKSRGQTKERGFSSSSTLIVTLSVSVSLFVMVLAISISDGFRSEVRDKASGFSGDLTITAPGVDPVSGLYPITSELSYYKKLQSSKGVENISGFAYRSGMVKNGDLIQGVVLKGVDNNYNWDFYNASLSQGRLPDFQDSLSSSDIIISERLASIMHLNVGDRVRIYFIDNSVRVATFQISGLYDAQLEEIDKTLIIADIRQVRRLNKWAGNEISGFEINLKKGGDTPSAQSEIMSIIYSQATVMDPSVEVSTVDQMYPHLFDWLKLLDYNVFVVLILMLSVAGFNMISGLLILLFEKISVIGLFKALGMRDLDIHKIFLRKGSSILLKGMFYGNLAALTVALIQKWFHIIQLDPANYFVKAVPIHIDLIKILSINAAAYLVVMLLMLLPSVFIAGVTPGKSLAVK